MFKGPTPKDYIPYVKLLRAAEALFQEKGFRATGVNLILAEAGVAKQTLYNHYSSKNGLIEALLRLKSKKVLAWLKAEVERRQRDLHESSIEALFNTYGAWFEEPGFRGCIFARAALEYAEKSHPVHKIAASHTGKLFSYLENLTGDLKTTLPCPAEHLLLLLEGAAAVSAKTGAGPATANRARQAAEALLRG